MHTKRGALFFNPLGQENVVTNFGLLIILYARFHHSYIFKKPAKNISTNTWKKCVNSNIFELVRTLSNLSMMFSFPLRIPDDCGCAKKIEYTYTRDSAPAICCIRLAVYRVRMFSTSGRKSSLDIILSLQRTNTRKNGAKQRTPRRRTRRRRRRLFLFLLWWWRWWRSVKRVWTWFNTTAIRKKWEFQYKGQEGGKILEQNQLNRLQMVQFEYPKYWNPCVSFTFGWIPFSHFQPMLLPLFLSLG